MSGTKMTVGSRAQVWHGTAKHTSGGLNKSQLMMNKSGRIVSRKKHASAKRENRLVKAGYKTKKGHFGFVKVGTRGRGRKGRKGMKGGKGTTDLHNQLWEQIGPANNSQNRVLMGGAIYGSDAIGAPYNGKGAGMGGDSIGVQLAAGMAGGRRRKRSMGMYGGVGMSMDQMLGQGGPQQAAMNASSGGRRRKRSMGMYGGTTKPFAILNGSPLNAALNAS